MKTNKIVRSSAILMILGLVMLLVALSVTNWHFPEQSYGRLVFAKTFADGAKMDRIEIVSNQETVTLENSGEYWKVKEASGYHSNIVLLNNILLNFNNAIYYTQRKFSKDLQKQLNLDENGVRIKTFVKDKKLDDIIVGKQAQSKNFWYVKPYDKDEIWLVDGNFILPREFYSWIMQPILEFPEEMVKAIKSDNVEISRVASRGNFLNSNGRIVSRVPFLKVANYIVAEDVKKINDFDKSKYLKTKQFELSMFGGLIITYNLFSDGNEFWMSINLKSIPLPKKEVNAYIKTNKLFYDGWIFKLPEVMGSALFNVSLI